MPMPINSGTRNIPLLFSKQLSDKVNKEWEDGSLIEKVTPVTRDLLKFWFNEPYTDNRQYNFHEGQKQAILNTIYLHEILQVDSVVDMYEKINSDLLMEMDAATLKKPKYNNPKYALKMATGTGKTWVMHALLLWQFLNAKYEQQKSGRFSKNFLMVAPGLIVFERLMDAYIGKENDQREREFESSDFYRYQELFIPSLYKDEVFGFIKGCVAVKEEIGRKVTGEGLIAITNWHLFMTDEEEAELEVSPLDDPSKALKDVFPITPGKSGGNTLEALDNNYFSGNEINYLANLPDLVVINDEAHHIHENKTYGEIIEVEWQKSLTKIAENKGKQFIQIDFSATPYDTTGSGQKRTKHYFPHIVVDFDLRTAIHKGLVKTIVIDKRKEIAALPLDFKAIRDESRKVVGLSDGQKLMLRAGVKKLGILEQHYVDATKDKEGVSNKHPKLLVMCEDTEVTKFVEDFLLKDEGLKPKDVVRIDSTKQGEIRNEEWLEIKQRLFNVDKHDKPRIIISVLMLREGFDVNNICVIVPLRASAAPILLEQTVGRGLRQMFREPEFQDVKAENRKRILIDKREPLNYLDILSIIEHPAFLEFYEDLTDMPVGVAEIEPQGRQDVIGDVITVGLKSNYKDYDLFYPIIIKDQEEELKPLSINIEALEAYPHFPLEKLMQFLGKEGEKFYSEEITVKTRFGEYVVHANLFTAESYNEFLEKMLNTITNTIGKISQRKNKVFPVMQVNQLELVRTVDQYIRTRMFGQPFNPLENSNWRVLLLHNAKVTQHIVEQFSKIIYEMQNNIEISDAMVERRYFSEVSELRMRERYSLPIVKTIYEKLAYPSNRGKFEKEFMEYADNDSQTEALIKINEYHHNFACVVYIRKDGLLSSYYPDFIVKTKDAIYIVETKSDKDIDDTNVIQKQLATLDWLDKVNQLKAEDRMDRVWKYVLLGEGHFYGMKDNGASIEEMLNLVLLDKGIVQGKLFQD